MLRSFPGFSTKLRPIVGAFAMGALLVLAIGWLLRQGDARSFSHALQATATQAGSNFVMATGPIDEAIEGVFFLDRVTGMLQCWVTSKNTGAFNGKFGYKNVLKDVGSTDEKNPQLLMMVGNYQPVGANGKLASCLVYVLNDTNGQFAVYSVPWNPMLHAKRPEPYVESMILVNTGMTREPIR
jgi:hypothetical protein